jgi:hypothetical protein
MNKIYTFNLICTDYAAINCNAVQLFIPVNVDDLQHATALTQYYGSHRLHTNSGLHSASYSIEAKRPELETDYSHLSRTKIMSAYSTGSTFNFYLTFCSYLENVFKDKSLPSFGTLRRVVC